MNTSFLSSSVVIIDVGDVVGDDVVVETVK